MRPFELAKLILGLLAVCAALLLASPGVRMAPATANELVSTEEPGPQCSTDLPPGADARAAALIARLRQEQMARIAAGAEGIIVLNGSGYNYGSSPGIELDRIRAEAARLPSR
jgi:hypothetical protein